MTKDNNGQLQHEITESQWLEICGLITLAREFRKQNEIIESVIEQKYPFIEGYFTDEYFEDLTLNAIRKKWLDNNRINLKIISDKSQITKLQECNL